MSGHTSTLYTTVASNNVTSTPSGPNYTALATTTLGGGMDAAAWSRCTLRRHDGVDISPVGSHTGGVVGEKEDAPLILPIIFTDLGKPCRKRFIAIPVASSLDDETPHRPKLISCLKRTSAFDDSGSALTSPYLSFSGTQVLGGEGSAEPDTPVEQYGDERSGSTVTAEASSTVTKKTVRFAEKLEWQEIPSDDIRPLESYRQANNMHQQVRHGPTHATHRSSLVLHCCCSCLAFQST